MSHRLRVVGLLGMLVLTAGLVACVGGDDEGADGDSEGGANGGAAGSGDTQAVQVTLGQPHEFGIELSSETAEAGNVTFEVTNGGALPHQFAIVQHDGGPDTLPVAQVNVDTSQVEVLGDSGDLDPGATASVQLDLEPGSYVIFSNTSGHYTAGMHAAFTVD